MISEQALICLCHKTKPAKCRSQSRYGIYQLPRAVLFRSPSHQPASAVSSIPGAQLSNETTLALGQDAKPNFTPQRLFQWIQLGGPELGHCPQQAAAPHECLGLGHNDSIWYFAVPCLKISSAVTILIKASKANAMHLSCCVQVTWTLMSLLLLSCHSSVLPPASERGWVPCQELQDEQVGFTNIH